MRTTIDIDADVRNAAKEIARQQHVAMGRSSRRGTRTRILATGSARSTPPRTRCLRRAWQNAMISRLSRVGGLKPCCARWCGGCLERLHWPDPV